MSKNQDTSNLPNMKNYPGPVSLESTIKIAEEMKKNICLINIGGKTKGLGFFCKIPFPDNEYLFSILITNYNTINREILEKEKEIFLLINNEKSPKQIKLGDRIKYTNEDYDITIVEIKEDKDSIYSFFELDENILIQETNKIIKQSMYILQNSKENLYVSYGYLYDTVKNKDYNFIHFDCLKENSVGCPILNMSNKLIGINMKPDIENNYNIGLFINY